MVKRLLKFKKSSGLSENAGERLRVEDGILKWKVLDLENYINTVIKVSFVDQSSQPVSVYITVGDFNRYEENGIYQYHYYEFTNEKYNFDTSASGYLEGEIPYTISAYLTGKSNYEINILNSNYSSNLQTTRLCSVDDETLKTVDGILTWNSVTNAQSYEITIYGEEEYNLTSLTNSLDVSSEINLPTGTYSINIRAIGSNILNSMSLANSIQGFVQLEVVEYSSIKISGGDIVWDAVENAQGYRVEFDYTDASGEHKVEEEVVTTNSFTAPVGIVGKFSIRITSVGVGEGKIFNSRTVEFTSSSDAPSEVLSFTFDANNSRFVIDVDNNTFLTSDSIVVSYDLTEFTETGLSANATNRTKTISYHEDKLYEIVDKNITRYYFPITIMGNYTNLSVQVVRPNTLPSNSVTSNDVLFNLFAYGNGSSENPYRIANATHLLNITYFSSANYELTKAIDMSLVSLDSRLSEHNAIIAKEFSGVLDGKGYAISKFKTDTSLKTDTIELNGVENFALFESISNATIKNLHIGSSDYQLILTNTFANASSNVINLSLLATTANNSRFEKISVSNVKIVVESSATKTAGNIYVGGLFKEMNNSTVTDTLINAEIFINSSISREVPVYVGGVSAMANLSNVNESEIKLILSTKTGTLLNYVGGVVGYYLGDETQQTGISSTSVEFNAENVSVSVLGGLVGFAQYIKVENCETSGKYKNNISVCHIGGLVGNAQNSIIHSSGSMMNLDVSVSNITNVYIGHVVGKLTSFDGVKSKMEDCYSTYYDSNYEQTQLSTSNLIIGMYGEVSTSNVEVSGSYKK